jgi:hypothetical protein
MHIVLSHAIDPNLSDQEVEELCVYVRARLEETLAKIYGLRKMSDTRIT